MRSKPSRVTVTSSPGTFWSWTIQIERASLARVTDFASGSRACRAAGGAVTVGSGVGEGQEFAKPMERIGHGAATAGRQVLVVQLG